MMRVEVVLLNENAVVPMKQTDEAAAFDLYSCKQISIQPNSRLCVPTGIAMQIPTGYMGLIKSRSSVALHHSVDACAGVIDSDYRGEILVLLHNHCANAEYTIKAGDRIAQLLLLPVPDFEMVRVRNLTGTRRGHDGFGSTGI